MWLLDIGASYYARDEANAYTAQALHALISPQARTVIWAHNAHISEHHDEVHGYGLSNPSYNANSWTSMGTLLKRQLNTDYMAIGLTAYEIHINWGDFTDPSPPTRDEGAVEHLLQGLGQPYLFLDLDSDFLTPEAEYRISSEWQIPSHQFDGLVFLSVSDAMVYAQ